MKPHTSTGLILALLSLMAVQPCAAQGPNRPTVGLALSGGGARGFAHIGVLEWFEQHRIPVDYIAGTSMGGLVGGLYAMGMDAAEVREFSRSLDWKLLLAAASPYEELTLRRREDRRQFPGLVEFGWKGGLGVADSLVSGHDVRLVFDRLTLPYGELASFDALPIPFRAVAVDLVSGRRVVMAHGSLSRALSATMAIPGIFKPVRDNGQVLVDGGLLDNLPADEVKAMGADIVVAVDVSTPLRKPEDLASLFAVLDQSVGVMMLDRVRRSRQAADVLLTPDLEGFTASDFVEVKALIEIGYETAEQRAAILQGLSLSRLEWQRHLDRRRSLRRVRMPVPSRVEVEAARSRTRTRLERDLVSEVGHPVDPASVEPKLAAVRGEGRLARLGYSVVPRRGESTLLIEAQEKSLGPPFLNLALTADNIQTDDVNFSLSGRLTFLDLGRDRAEWRTDVSVGSLLAIRSEYYVPVGGGFFVAPRASASRSKVNLFRDGRREAEYLRIEGGGGIDFGWGVGRRHDEVRLGLSLGHGDAEVRIGEPLLATIKGTVSAATLRWSHDALDAPVVPRRGWSLEVNNAWFFESPGAKTGFPQSEFRLSGFVPVGTDARSSIVLRSAGGTTYGKTAPPLEQFTLGGHLRLGGLGADELRGSRYLLFSPGYRYQLASLPALVGDAVHLFAWYEVGSVFERGGPRDYVHSGSLGVVAETLLGPVFVGGSWAEQGRMKLYFSLGRVF